MPFDIRDPIICGCWSWGGSQNQSPTDAKGRVVWSDLEGLLGREEALKIGQNSLGKKTAGDKAQGWDRPGDLGTDKRLNLVGAEGLGKW